MVRILGLDPGTRVTGYGIVDAEGSRLAYVDAGVLRADPKAPLEERLAILAAGLREIVDRHRPAAAAVEDVFVKADPRAALAVGHGRGAMLCILGERGIAVSSYAPARVKRAVAGNGKAGKEEVGRMVGAILGADRSLPLDATDALATAIAHALSLHRAQALKRQ